MIFKTAAVNHIYWLFLLLYFFLNWWLFWLLRKNILSSKQIQVLELGVRYYFVFVYCSLPVWSSITGVYLVAGYHCRKKIEKETFLKGKIYRLFHVNNLFLIASLAINLLHLSGINVIQTEYIPPSCPKILKLF